MKCKQPLLKEWQAQAVLDMATVFYADPKNRAALEAWKKQREKKCKRPAGAGTPAGLQG